MPTAKIPQPLLRKSERAVALAQLFLSDGAANPDVEDLAFALVWMPDQELAKMHSRLSAERGRRTQVRQKR